MDSLDLGAFGALTVVTGQCDVAHDGDSMGKFGSGVVTVQPGRSPMRREGALHLLKHGNVSIDEGAVGAVDAAFRIYQAPGVRSCREAVRICSGAMGVVEAEQAG